jgi:hypothetical protein
MFTTKQQAMASMINWFLYQSDLKKFVAEYEDVKPEFVSKRQALESTETGGALFTAIEIVEVLLEEIDREARDRK